MSCALSLDPATESDSWDADRSAPRETEAVGKRGEC